MVKKLLKKLIGLKSNNIITNSNNNALDKYNKIPHLSDQKTTEQIKDKTVILRVDYDVPIKLNKNNKSYSILDNNKIKQTIPTIKHLLKNNCKIVILTHLREPNGHEDKYSTKKIAKELEILINPNKKSKQKPKKSKKQTNNKTKTTKITFLSDCIGKDIKEKIKRAKQKSIFLCENLRFYKEENENNDLFAHSLAELGDFYINDAFSISHYKQSSITKLPRDLPNSSGFLLEKELKHKLRLLKPRKPCIWLMGGTNFQKLNTIKKAIKCNSTNIILVGGALAFPFLKAKGYNIGHSLSNSKATDLAKQILNLKEAKDKLILPTDFITSTDSKTWCNQVPRAKLASNSKTTLRKVNNIKSYETAFDIGPESTRLFGHYIKQAKTIVINGPMGQIEQKKYQTTTKQLLTQIAKQSKTHQSFSIIGGKDSTRFLRSLKLEKDISHVSLGGGALMTFLNNKHLPGLDALVK